MASTRPNLPNPMAGPPHGPHGATSAERTSGLPSKRLADTAALWPASRSKEATSGRCSSETAWRGTTGSMLRMKRGTGAYSARPATRSVACGHNRIRSHRGSGGTARQGRARHRQRTVTAQTSTPSRKRSVSLSATSRATLTIWTEMETGRLARAFRAGRNAKSPPRRASFLSVEPFFQ